MFVFFLRKLIGSFCSLILVITLTFFLIKVIPGDPFVEEKAISQEVRHALFEHYGFNDPIWKQYVRYLINILSFDFGPSLKYPDRTVNQIIKDGSRVSFVIGIQSLIVSIILGVAIGVYAGAYSSKYFSRSLVVFSSIAVSLPGFVKASILQYVFAIKLGIFPVARWGTFAHSVLPVISISLLPTAHIARLVMVGMQDVMSQDFILAAKARGLSNNAILFNHALRCAIFPVLTFLGPLIASILCGTFVVEKVFGIPGMGSWWVKSVNNRDYFLIMGITIFYSTILLVANLIIDLAYIYLDPRVDICDSNMDSTDA